MRSLDQAPRQVRTCASPLAGLLAFTFLMLLTMPGCESATTPLSSSPKAGARPVLARTPDSRVEARPPTASPKISQEPSPIRFRDASETCGINFVHTSGNSPEKDFPTCLGSGVAMLDYDCDGNMDLYFASTRNLPLSAPDLSKGNRLYRNRGDATFEDVTDRAGVGFRGFNHGLAAADVDNDGDVDLYLANLGPNVLYLNNGNGTFRDATAVSNLECPAWSCGAAFFDLDGDGRLDLYVSNYGEWSPDAARPFCGDKARNLRTICSPTTIAPRKHALYQNRGDGTFKDVTDRAGIGRRDGRGLGVIAVDVNRDGRTDLYIANDKCPNFLFLNRGDGTFEDATETSGAAGNEAGEFQGSMGVDAEDLTGDGWPELVCTNFRSEGTTLYRNVRGGNFLDVSSAAGILPDTKPYVGWGVALADLDGDGRLDLLVVHGHVDDNLPLFGKDIPQSEPAKVWRNPESIANGIAFRIVPQPGTYFETPHVARGAAFGDLDNDGDLDVVINHQDGRPAILLNDSPPQAWIRFSLVGHRSNRSAIGASIKVHAGGNVYHRQVKGGGSYLSANDPRILVGLGSAERVDRVEIHWPSGARSTETALAIGRTYIIHEPETAEKHTREPGP